MTNGSDTALEPWGCPECPQVASCAAGGPQTHGNGDDWMPPKGERVAHNGDDGNGNGVWKVVAVSAIGVIISGAGFWLLLGRNAVTRAEMNEALTRAVTKDAGYSEDRKLIHDKLAGIERLSEDMAVIRDAVKELSGQMKMLSQQAEAKGRR